MPPSVSCTPPSPPPGFLFYMLMCGGLDSLVADPSKVRRTRRAACCTARFLRRGCMVLQPLDWLAADPGKARGRGASVWELARDGL